MAMHGVCFTLVAQEASCGGESGILAGIDLAAVGFEVRIHKLAIIIGLVMTTDEGATTSTHS
jgi:hypothetical protein